MGSMFEVKSIPLQYIRAVGTYHKSLNVRKAQHTKAFEHAMHFW